ncbi:MAG: GNAT family N-acetyltransferase [Geodermatophilaceae bacterium]|nr:GNAT family N-acetyltransferase [Geodermatophilaceae bacterium]
MSTGFQRTVPRSGSTGVSPGLRVVRSSAEETAALRRAVLRPHLAIRQMTVAGDQNPDTAYLAVRALAGNGAVLGCVRLEPVGCPWSDSIDADTQAAWQLRSMATDPCARGSGLGRLLVEAALNHVAERGGDLVWCNARVGAEGFYSRLGFHTVTGRFAISEVTEDHVGMIWTRP